MRTHFQEEVHGTAKPSTLPAVRESAESESSWGELQDAGGSGGEEEEVKDFAESSVDAAEPSGAGGNDEASKEAVGGVIDGVVDGRRQEDLAVDASVDHTVGGDAVMVYPRDEVSENGVPSGGVGSTDGMGVGRRPNLGALMTMLVVSLRMQRLVHWVVRKRCLDGLSEENLIDLLSALEVTMLWVSSKSSRG